MIDTRYREAVRYCSDFSYTRELRCPVCGMYASYRSWNAEKEAFAFHCNGCGHDTELTWKELAVLRATGELKWDEDGNAIVPEDVTVPPLPEDPNNNAFEKWDIMKDAEAAPEEEKGDTPKIDVVPETPPDGGDEVNGGGET